MSRDRITRWLFLAGGLAALVLVLRGADLHGAMSLLLTAGPLLGLALVPYTLQIGLDALAWRTLLGALGRKVSWRKLFAIRLSSEAVLMSVPAGSIVAEGLKPYLLARTAAVPASETVATVAVKKALLVMAEAVYLLSALLLGWSLLAAVSPTLVAGPGLPLMVAGGVAFLLVVAFGLGAACLSGSLGDRVHRAIMRLPVPPLARWIDARRAAFEQTDAAFSAIGRSPGRLIAAQAMLLAAWFSECLETWLLCRLLGLELPFVHALVLESTAVFVRNVALALPAGLGVQDAAYVAFLRAFALPGAAAVAPAFVILKRVKEITWIALGYLVMIAVTGERRLPKAVLPPGAAGTVS